MEDFLYCYLSPTLVGLLAGIAIILGIVGGILFLGWISTIIGDRVSISISDKAYKVIETTGTVALNIFAVILAIILGSMLIYGAWSLGLDLLKRVVCIG